MKLNQLLHGGDYNPEQWVESPEILKKDIKFMKKARINTVTLGVFSWSALEPEEGVFCFEWLEEIVEKLWKENIHTILATPSGARPKWLSDEYPEVLRMDEDRRRQLFGGRHNHCYTSSIYREKVRIINRELSKRFGKHPAVLMWHLSNEYGGTCHCPLCQKAFQKWLKERYQTIERLNKKWYTSFWSHTYNSFSQIESPSSIGESMLHGLNLDWKRFTTDQTIDFIKNEIAALRVEGSNKPTTTNMMYNYEGLNYHKVAKAIDVISWDTYPLWHKEKEIITARDNAMQHDYMRSLKGKPFLLMESCPSSTNWQSVSKLKKPGMLQGASLQAIAHGSDSVMYFQMRQSRGSSEKFHGAVIDHYGEEDTRVFKEICESGKALETLLPLVGTETYAQVALIYDMENRWAMEDAQGPRNKGMHYKEAVLKSYNALRKIGINVDVIDSEQDMSKYKMVVAPMLYMFRESIEERIRAFVKGGGHFILTYWSGIVDETDLCFLGKVPYKLDDVFGFYRTEIDGLYDGEMNTVVPTKDSEIKNSYTCKYLCDLIKITTAKTVMEYEKDFYKGYPAATTNFFGKGKASYICADVEQEFYDEWYYSLAKDAKIKPILEIEVPEGVEVTSRCSELEEYIMIQNFNQYSVELEIVEEVVYGTGRILQPFEMMVVKRKIG